MVNNYKQILHGGSGRHLSSKIKKTKKQKNQYELNETTFLTSVGEATGNWSLQQYKNNGKHLYIYPVNSSCFSRLFHTYTRITDIDYPFSLTVHVWT